MTPIRSIAATAVVLGSLVAAPPVLAQPTTTRTDLSRHDLSVPGREVLQVLVGFAPGVEAAAHSHPGEELVYVTAGVLEYRLEGQPPVTLKAGEVLFIPRGVVHSARNVGKTPAAELATYIVEKGKPLLAPAR